LQRTLLARVRQLLGQGGHTAEEIAALEAKAKQLEAAAQKLEAGASEAESLAAKAKGVGQEAQADLTAYQEAVAAGNLEQLRGLRQQYVQEVEALTAEAERLGNEGKTAEEIARTLHARRRELGVTYKNMTPPGTLARIYERNLQKYGDPLGPTIEWLRDRGKSWEDIIASASRTGGQDLVF
jgi:DNA repair exonuclease SbcCD ATPase subunit